MCPTSKPGRQGMVLALLHAWHEQLVTCIQVTVSDDHNNQYKVQKEFSDFVQLAKMINKDIPRAKLELPPRGAKAFIAKLSYKKFQQTR